MVVGGASYTTSFKTASSTGTDSVIAANYHPATYVFGEEAVQTPKGTLTCVVVDSKANHSVVKKHYLYPVPLSQITLNSKLLQNPGTNRNNNAISLFILNQKILCEINSPV